MAAVGDPFPDLRAVLAFMPRGTLRLAPLAIIPASVVWLVTLTALRGRARRSAGAALMVVAVCTPIVVGWSFCRTLHEVSGPTVRFTWSPKPDWISWGVFEVLGNGVLILAIWFLEIVAIVWAAWATIPFGAGLCKRCGYSRAGLAADAACPECGSGGMQHLREAAR
jgi:hypothetical protein